MKNKRAQITIFIIIGLVLLISIILIFLLKSKIFPKIGGEESEINPNDFLKTCLQSKVRDSVEILLSKGGYINNTLNKKFKFSGEGYNDIAYLCYTGKNYLPCINQEPMLITHLENETKDYILKKVEGCFDSLALSLEDEAYVVDARYSGFNVSLKEGKVVIDIDAKLKLTKNEQTSNCENFEVIIPSKIYDLALVVQEITSQEAKYCHFEDTGYMVFYPTYKIKTIKTSDLIEIYSVLHKESNENFRFAVRTCVIPPGI